eukprot:745995-Hanusia_phi.AAC.4
MSILVGGLASASNLTSFRRVVQPRCSVSYTRASNRSTSTPSALNRSSIESPVTCPPVAFKSTSMWSSFPSLKPDHPTLHVEHAACIPCEFSALVKVPNPQTLEVLIVHREDRLKWKSLCSPEALLVYCTSSRRAASFATGKWPAAMKS